MTSTERAGQFFDGIISLSLEEQRHKLWSLLKSDAPFSLAVAEHCEQIMIEDIFQADGAVNRDRLNSLKASFFDIQDMRIETPGLFPIDDEAFRAMSMVIDFILEAKKEKAPAFMHVLAAEALKLSVEERQMPECIVYILYSAVESLPAWLAEQQCRRGEDARENDRISGQSTAVDKVNSRLPKIILKKNKLS